MFKLNFTELHCLFIFGYSGSSLQCTGFSSSCSSPGLISSFDAWSSHYRGLCRAEAWAQGTRASVLVPPWLRSPASWALGTGSGVVARMLSCSSACRISLDQGFFPTEPPGKPCLFLKSRKNLQRTRRLTSTSA